MISLSAPPKTLSSREATWNLQPNNVLDGFQALLSDFGQNSTDLISLDFNVTAHSFADGILSLTGSGAQGVSLRFANLPTKGGFAFSESNNVTDITWRT